MAVLEGKASSISPVFTRQTPARVCPWGQHCPELRAPDLEGVLQQEPIDNRTWRCKAAAVISGPALPGPGMLVRRKQTSLVQLSRRAN